METESNNKKFTRLSRQHLSHTSWETLVNNRPEPQWSVNLGIASASQVRLQGVALGLLLYTCFKHLM